MCVSDTLNEVIPWLPTMRCREVRRARVCNTLGIPTATSIKLAKAIADNALPLCEYARLMGLESETVTCCCIEGRTAAGHALTPRVEAIVNASLCCTITKTSPNVANIDQKRRLGGREVQGCKRKYRMVLLGTMAKALKERGGHKHR
mmetsp:Transcript_109457/g.211934  ORF Transcript_109457/g.211934 Transcript_109457/m.211934 type:complete len:147 (+) Transcript_109457:199-639(+)